MHPTEDHPSQEKLNAYNLGQLPSDEAIAIEKHISTCDPCCDTVACLSTDDTFVGLLKTARRLPTDQTVDFGAGAASLASQEVPKQLGEHSRYEVLGLIGKGGMGEVYKARHRKMERTVALKVIHRGLIRRAEAIDRFHREVKAAAQLSHPNIVTAHDADQAGDYHFMVMEFVDGVDLSRIVQDRGALSIADACGYVRQAAIGLQHAHERGMVHRDIKPHNLMVTADGTVKILDFGLASLAPDTLSEVDMPKSAGDLTAVGAIMGTPDYISPEQAQDARQADIRSDIYSLGATLYFLLTGRPLFKDGTVLQKLRSHAQLDPEPLACLRSDIPAELAAIVGKMTAKEPSERFQTPGEVASALESFIQATKPVPSRERQPYGQPIRSRNRWLPLTAIATILVTSIVASFVYYIQTKNGIVRVEVIDESLAVDINGHTVTIQDGLNKAIKIQPGERKLLIRQVDSDLEFETDNFEVTRNGQLAFQVDLIEGEVVVHKDGKLFDRGGLSPRDPKQAQEGTENSQTLGTVENVDKRAFAYDISLVPEGAVAVYGYRPYRLHQDKRFEKLLATFNLSNPQNNYLRDANLKQVLNVRWENEGNGIALPIVILTVLEGTATDFARLNLGVEIGDQLSEADRWKYHSVGANFSGSTPEEQFVRFIDDKTLVIASKETHDAHQIALKSRSTDDLGTIASSLSDGAAWMIGSTSNQNFVKELEFYVSQFPPAASLMSGIPVWQETSHLAMSLTLDDSPTLQLSAHAISAERQKQVSEVARALPISMANLLRALGNGTGPFDADTISAVMNDLNETTVTEPSDTETRITVPLKEAEPHLFRALNSVLGLQ